jgi:hypothetical protein
MLRVPSDHEFAVHPFITVVPAGRRHGAMGKLHANC